MEYPNGDAYTYGMSMLPSLAAIATAIIAIVGGAAIARLFMRR